MTELIRNCTFCGIEIDSKAHKNKKFCSKSCVDKARYKKYGQRILAERRKFLYNKRKLKEGYTQKLRDLGNKMYYKIQDFIRTYKLNCGCKDCGYKEHHAALEFDHVRGVKKLNVANAKSINQAKMEIEKCEVVCSNCHKIRTYNRLQENKIKIEE